MILYWQPSMRTCFISQGFQSCHNVNTSSKALVSSLSNPIFSYAHLHNVLKHISSDRYEMLSCHCSDMPILSCNITNNHEFVPSHVSKIGKGQISLGPAIVNQLQEETHFSISGPVEPNIGQSRFAIDFLEPSKYRSHVTLLNENGFQPRRDKGTLPGMKVNFHALVIGQSGFGVKS